MPLQEILNNLRKLNKSLQSEGGDKLLIDISEDDVGLSKDATLQKLVNALLSVDTDKIVIDIGQDDVGLSKDATLQKLVNALLSVNTDKIVIDVGQDDVGLAKDATLQDVKSELAQSCILTQALSYSNTGTTTANYTVLSSPLSIDFNGAVTIQILLNVSTTVQLELTPSGSTTTYTGDLNDGSALTANAWYEFEFNVNNGDSINFVIPVPAGDSLTGLLRVFKRER